MYFPVNGQARVHPVCDLHLNLLIEAFAITTTVRATKSGSDLPLYEIGVLLKIGGTGSYYNCLLHHPNYLSQR